MQCTCVFHFRWWQDTLHSKENEVIRWTAVDSCHQWVLYSCQCDPAAEEPARGSTQYSVLQLHPSATQRKLTPCFTTLSPSVCLNPFSTNHHNLTYGSTELLSFLLQICYQLGIPALTYIILTSHFSFMILSYLHCIGGVLWGRQTALPEHHGRGSVVPSRSFLPGLCGGP